jgi:hypothetical protein
MPTNKMIAEVNHKTQMKSRKSEEQKLQAPGGALHACRLSYRLLDHFEPRTSNLLNPVFCSKRGPTRTPILFADKD